MRSSIESIFEVSRLEPQCRAVVAIPACNEADRIGDCLASLAVQHDIAGAPLAQDLFAVLVLANNCTDGTVEAIKGLRDVLPYPVRLVERSFPAERSNAGWARKIAMDCAADLLAMRSDGVILTTDADSSVGGTWMSNTLAAIDSGVDAVAGYIEAQPRELLRLGAAFLQRGRIEDTYLSAIAEIAGRCDPLPHDPWPNHRVSSGASLAVTAAAYKAIGGLPPKPIGEDAALSQALLDSGFKVRHAMDVSVVTSCRLDGRAAGGAADTMRLRHDEPEAVCDSDIEPARLATRRMLWKGRLRRWHAEDGRIGSAGGSWRRLGLPSDRAAELVAQYRHFEPFWRAIEAESPKLQRPLPLRPSDLPMQIDTARAILQRLGTSGRLRTTPTAAGRLNLNLLAPAIADHGHGIKPPSIS